MKRDRNHEGYHDPTACQAIRKADEKPRESRFIQRRLYYHIGEMASFKEAVRSLR